MTLVTAPHVHPHGGANTRAIALVDSCAVRGNGRRRVGATGRGSMRGDWRREPRESAHSAGRRPRGAGELAQRGTVRQRRDGEAFLQFGSVRFRLTVETVVSQLRRGARGEAGAAVVLTLRQVGGPSRRGPSTSSSSSRPRRSPTPSPAKGGNAGRSTTPARSPIARHGGTSAASSCARRRTWSPAIAPPDRSARRRPRHARVSAPRRARAPRRRLRPGRRS